MLSEVVEERLDEGRDEGLIDFEVGEEAVEVQDEGFEEEGGIEAEERLWL